MFVKSVQRCNSKLTVVAAKEKIVGTKMGHTKVEISSFQLFLIFLYVFSAIVQIIGVYVLYHTKNLRVTQRIILINIGICHISYSISCICDFSKMIWNSQELIGSPCLYVVILGFNYTLLVHYLSIDRMLEIYLHLKYPIVMTKQISYFVIILLWLISLLLAFIVLLVTCFYPNLKGKLSMYLLPIMIWSVLCTALLIYSYMYRKWTSLRRNVPRIKQSAQRNSNAFLIPFLIVFTFTFFQGSGSVLMMIQNTVELSAMGKSLLECVMAMLFAFGVISDALIYIFLRKDIRKKFLLKIRNCLAGISPQFKCWSS